MRIYLKALELIVKFKDFTNFSPISQYDLRRENVIFFFILAKFLRTVSRLEKYESINQSVITFFLLKINFKKLPNRSNRP